MFILCLKISFKNIFEFIILNFSLIIFYFFYKSNIKSFKTFLI